MPSVPIQDYTNFLPTRDKMTSFSKLFVVNNEENEVDNLSVNDITIWKTKPPQIEPVYENTQDDVSKIY